VTDVHWSVLRLWLKRINREPRFAGMVGLLLVGAGGLFFAGLPAKLLLPFLFNGVTIQGTLVSKHDEALRDHRPRRYFIRYEFVDAAGNRHQCEDRAPFAEWNALKPGDAVAIRYIRSEPARSRPEGIIWQDFRELLPLAILGLAMTAGAVWVGAIGICRVITKTWFDCHGDSGDEPQENV
jgi:hypothetical protein